jgi:hypothetical protein
VIHPDHIAEVFRIEPRGEQGRPDKIAEHHGEKPPFGRGVGMLWMDG